MLIDYVQFIPILHHTCIATSNLQLTQLIQFNKLLSSCKFHNHSSVVASKANHMLAIISKSFQYMDGNILLNLYKSFIQNMVL